MIYGVLQQCHRRITDPRDRPGRRPLRVGRHQPSGRLRPGQPRGQCSCYIEKQAAK